MSLCLNFFFNLNTDLYAKMCFRKYCICSEILTKTRCVNSCFSKVFRQYSLVSEFSVFLKTVFSAEILINRDRLECILCPELKV